MLENPFKSVRIENVDRMLLFEAWLLKYLLYFVVSIFISGSSEDFIIFFITGLSILLSCISFEWFFQGIEDFKFITIRSIIVKVVTVVCLFVFVKSKEDLIAYGLTEENLKGMEF